MALRGIRLALIGLAIVSALGMRPSPASAYNEIVKKVEATPWTVVPLRGDRWAVKGRYVTIRIPSGYCLGNPKPRVDHVKIVERPQTEQRSFKSAVLTAFVASFEPAGPERPANAKRLPPCAGKGLTLEKRVRLKRPVENLFLFDGYYAPPRRAWPPLDR